MYNLASRLRLLLLSFFFLSSVCSAGSQCDFNGDGFADLAIGVPDEDINGQGDAGAVNVFYGRAGGLSATNNQFWSRDSANVPGAPDNFERFGASLVCGDFNGDQLDDLAIGATGTDVSGIDRVGSVTVLYGSTSETLRRWNPGVDTG